jgi:hypothetical protein
MALPPCLRFSFFGKVRYVNIDLLPLNNGLNLPHDIALMRKSSILPLKSVLKLQGINYFRNKVAFWAAVFDFIYIYLQAP